MGRDKLMDTIRKLQAKADSAADLGLMEEAQAFAGKVQELLLKHKLTMSEVMFRQQDTDDPIGTFDFDFDQQDVRATKSRLAWRETLLMAVCGAHFCQPFISKKWKDGATRKTRGYFTVYQIVGRESDREIATYMLAYLINTAELVARQEYRKQRRSGRLTKGFKIAFYDAFAREVAKRYRELERKVREEGFAGVSSSVAVVRLDQTRHQVAKWVEQHFGPTYTVKGPARRRSYNLDGYSSGQDAGSKVDLTRKGMGQGGRKREIGGGS